MQTLAQPTTQPKDTASRRNTVLGIINGIAFYVGETFSDPYLVLPLFVRQLGGSSSMVALLPLLRNGGWTLPQILNAGKVQSMTYKVHSYRRAGIIRWFLWLALVVVVWLAQSIPATIALGAFLLFYSGYNLTAGMGALAFQDVVAKTIPVHKRGMFFGARNFFGGLLAFFIAGAAVKWLLSSTSPFGFPYNYGILVLATLLFIGPGILVFSFIKEPPTIDPPARTAAHTMLAQIPGLLRRDRNFREYIWARIITRFTMLADPFYVVYATEVLHIRPRMVGIYLAIRVCMAAVSNLLWARVADKHGNRRLTLLTNLLMLLVPIAALGCVALNGLISTDAMGWLFGVVFAISGFAIDGAGIAQLTYVMELAPEHERSLYVAVLNTALGLATFMLIIGGFLVDLAGYEILFGVTTVFGVLALWRSWRMPEPRHQHQLLVQSAQKAAV